jgi:hypothetical protein
MKGTYRTYDFVFYEIRVEIREGKGRKDELSAACMRGDGEKVIYAEVGAELR